MDGKYFEFNFGKAKKVMQNRQLTGVCILESHKLTFLFSSRIPLPYYCPNSLLSIFFRRLDTLGSSKIVIDFQYILINILIKYIFLNNAQTP